MPARLVNRSGTPTLRGPPAGPGPTRSPAASTIRTLPAPADPPAAWRAATINTHTLTIPHPLPQHQTNAPRHQQTTITTPSSQNPNDKKPLPGSQTVHPGLAALQVLLAHHLHNNAHCGHFTTKHYEVIKAAGDENGVLPARRRPM